MSQVALRVQGITAVVANATPLVRLMNALAITAEPAFVDRDDGAVVVRFGTAPVRLEVRALENRGSGFHHITLEVSDLHDAVEGLRARGLRLAGGDIITAAHGASAWLDPEQGFGGVIELREARGGHQDATATLPPISVGHIGWAVRDIDAARTCFVRLGFAVADVGIDTPVFAANEATVRSTPCTISLKAPSGPGPFARFVAKRTGPHHLMFRVPDIAAAMSTVRSAGFRLTYDAPLDEGFALTQFVHPKDTGGVLIELGQLR